MFTADSKSKTSGSPGMSKAGLAATARPHKGVGTGFLSPHSTPSTSAKASGKLPLSCNPQVYLKILHSAGAEKRWYAKAGTLACMDTCEYCCTQLALTSKACLEN